MVYYFEKKWHASYERELERWTKANHLNGSQHPVRYTSDAQWALGEQPIGDLPVHYAH